MVEGISVDVRRVSVCDDAEGIELVEAVFIDGVLRLPVIWVVVDECRPGGKVFLVDAGGWCVVGESDGDVFDVVEELYCSAMCG